jgi:hypothetical protein
MQGEIGFLRRRHYSLMRAVENLEHNFNAFADIENYGVDFRDIRDPIGEYLLKVKAIRTAIEDKISELEGAS